MGVGSHWDFYSIYTVVDAEANGRETKERGWLGGKSDRCLSHGGRAGEQGRELKKHVAGETGACATL